MRKIATLFVMVFATISCTNAQQKQFSKKALSEKLTNVDGKEVLFSDILKEYKGKKVVMEVWASWCSDCVKAMPKVKELQANNPDVVYLFVSMDKAFDKWKAGIEKHELKGEHYWCNDVEGMKGSFGKAIDLDWIPRYIGIDADGKVLLYRAIETDFEIINTTLKN